MNQEKDRPIDLGAVSLETKGGPMGFVDQERTKWPGGLGLTDD
jgi:hypothetical protein